GRRRFEFRLTGVQFVDKHSILAFSVLITRPKIKLVSRMIAALVIHDGSCGDGSFCFGKIERYLANEAIMVSDNKYWLSFAHQFLSDFAGNFSQVRPSANTVQVVQLGREVTAGEFLNQISIVTNNYHRKSQEETC